MPWSPLKYTEEIFEHLRRKGFVNEVRFETLRAAIMLKTGLIRSETIKRVLAAFEDLEYIESTTTGTFKITYWNQIKKEGGSKNGN